MTTRLKPDLSIHEKHVWEGVMASPATAVAAIWVASTVAAVFAPDLVSGSEQDHIPIAAISIWLWTLVATGYVLLATRAGASTTLTVATSAIWAAVAVVVLAAPVMVTGTDPTSLPITALLAPPIGAVATGFVAIHHAGLPLRG